MSALPLRGGLLNPHPETPQPSPQPSPSPCQYESHPSCSGPLRGKEPLFYVTLALAKVYRQLYTHPKSPGMRPASCSSIPEDTLSPLESEGLPFLECRHQSCLEMHMSSTERHDHSVSVLERFLMQPTNNCQGQIHTRYMRMLYFGCEPLSRGGSARRWELEPEVFLVKASTCPGSWEAPGFVCRGFLGSFLFQSHS